MEKDFRVYWDNLGFVTVRVVVKGRIKPEILVFPLAPGIKIVDMATNEVKDWSDLKEYVEKP